ncbi:hypothetical protein ACFVXE_39100 [Streptomyces sp. NPDC058231]|uniref:hypothetical protein n=1 Tax=Streptomyces sp. NPDC058231 TaxID=3346392 RepID=UPI0036EDFA79
MDDSLLRLTAPDETFGECDGAAHRSRTEKLLIGSDERGHLRFGIHGTAALGRLAATQLDHHLLCRNLVDTGPADDALADVEDYFARHGENRQEQLGVASSWNRASSYSRNSSDTPPPASPPPSTR